MEGGRWVLDEAWVLDASRERVFRALTDPVDLRVWWGPAGFTIPEVDVDLRAGGRYRFTMQPPAGERFHLSGEFVEVTPPSAVRFTFRWDEPSPDDVETLVGLTLHPADGGTRLALHQGTFRTEERLALHREGWRDSVEKLRTLVGG